MTMDILDLCSAGRADTADFRIHETRFGSPLFCQLTGRRALRVRDRILAIAGERRAGLTLPSAIDENCVLRFLSKRLAFCPHDVSGDERPKHYHGEVE
jgi:hypothetical protein